MSKEILLTLEKFRDGEETNFLIQSAKEIQLTLQAIAKNKTPVVLYFDNKQRFLKSFLLGVNEKGIWLDVGPDEDDNAALLNSGSISFVTQRHSVKVQFICHQIVLAIYASLPAFYFPLPESIVRLQRRDDFRLSTSGDAPLKCIIPHKDSPEDHQSETTIIDISLGGIRLICKEQGVKLETGEIYPDCRIELPDIGTLLATLQVKSIVDASAPNGTVIKHAGCQFRHLDRNMSMMLQRYVALMQSRLSARDKQ